MKNYEFYKDKILNTLATHLAVVNGTPVNCDNASCRDCIFNHDNECVTSNEKMEEWLNTEHKEVKITAFDKEFLMRLAEEFNYLARDKEGELWAYFDTPIREKDGAWNTWGGSAEKITHVCDNFPEIKQDDEKPTDIEEFLRICEVIS